MASRMPNRIPLSFAVRAIVAIVFGLLMLIFPRHALPGLIFAFAVFVLLEGLASLIAAAFARSWTLLFSGLLSVVVGVFFLSSPLASAAALVAFLAIWMVLIGVLVIATALQQRKFVRHPWVHVIAGIVPIVFGLWLLVWPFMGLAGLAMTIGIYSLSWGILLLWTAYELWYVRSLPDEEARAWVNR